MSLAVAVVGTGHMGAHHARILSGMENIELKALVDIDKEKADRLARRYNTKSYTDYREILDKVDAAIIAVPTNLHYTITKDMLLHNIHCMVEKPITETLETANELVELAKERNLVLQVGFVERFNPAVLSAKDYIYSPKYIEARRLTPYDTRTAYINVVLDLMIHDIDMVLSLLNYSSPVSIDAIGAKVFSEEEDIANARIKFNNGCIVDIGVSRISLVSYRKIRIFQEDSYISIDYIARKVKIYRKKGGSVKNLKDIEIIVPEVEKVEPLYNELRHFIECIYAKKEPCTSGKEGYLSLELAINILKEIRKPK
jgi:predicted dehydrogenase